MSNNKQSSIEWLFEQVCNLDWKNIQGEKKLEILEQAKAMHKQEIEDTYWLGYGDHQTQNIHNLDEIFDYILGGNNEGNS